MPSETMRKVLKIGGRTGVRHSSAITLPAPWVRYHNLDGEQVRVFFDDVLIVLPLSASAEIERRVREILGG